MASGVNGGGSGSQPEQKTNVNLVDELEEAFQNCIHALTKEEPGIGEDNTDVKQDVDLTTLKFIDLVSCEH